MQVIEKEYSVTGYDRTLRIEREGEVYWISVHWDNEGGYEANWFNENHRFIPTPQWAIDMEEEGTEPLGYRLELMAEEESK